MITIFITLVVIGLLIAKNWKKGDKIMLSLYIFLIAALSFWIMFGISLALGLDQIDRVEATVSDPQAIELLMNHESNKKIVQFHDQPTRLDVVQVSKSGIWGNLGLFHISFPEKMYILRIKR